MDSLFKAARKACPSALWARGVQLARDGAVTGERVDGEDVELRVGTGHGPMTHLVCLFPEDDDWSCECDTRFDACEHVAAAVIALREARKAGAALPGGDTEAARRIGYRLLAHEGSLALSRVLVGAAETLLPGPLSAMASGKLRAPKFLATEQDLTFDRVVGGAVEGVIPKSRMRDVLKVLKVVEDVKMGGEPLEIGEPRSGLCVRVTEEGEGFRVRMGPDPAVDETFKNGVLRYGKTLHPLAPHGLGDRLWDMLRLGRVYEGGDVGTLVGDLLPTLRGKIPVRVETDRLPSTARAKPRIQVSTGRDGAALTVLATLVYGDPPVARVDGDRLTRLGDGDVPVRNKRAEAVLLEQLRDDLGLEPGVRSTSTGFDAIDVADRVRGLDPDASRVEGRAHEAYFDAGSLTPRLDPGQDFALYFETGEGSGAGAGGGGGRGQADPAAVMRAFEAGEDLVPLLGGGFAHVPAEWLGQHGHRVAGLLAAREAAGEDSLPASATFDVAALCEALGEAPPPAFEGLRALVQDFQGLPAADLPADLNATLRDYQTEGVAWLGFMRTAGMGALLADDMGLGKTLQTLCAIRGRTLVVAPTSVLHNWVAEIKKFRPQLTTNLYHGPGRTLDGADVTVTSFALLRLDLERLSQESWETVVIDEAQAIKNPDSQLARAAHALPGSFRIALSGTPVENRLEDLWSVMQYLNPGLLGSRSDFQGRYVRPGAAGDETALAALRGRVRPFLLRRLKRDVVAELPPRTDVVLHCELSAEERAVYDTVRAATREDIAGRVGSDVMAMLEALLRLRQAACHASLVPGQTFAPDRLSSKLDVVMSVLSEAVEEGHKALVFSQWTSLLDRVEPHLKAAGIDFVRLDGSTADRGAVVDAFQSDDGPPVLLASLKAGGTGLNLTAADHVMLLDPWWNPAAEEQAADRAHRIGQERPVLVHRFVARDTVEEGILRLQEKKRALADAAVGDGGAGASITRDELLALLD